MSCPWQIYIKITLCWWRNFLSPSEPPLSLSFVQGGCQLCQVRHGGWGSVQRGEPIPTWFLIQCMLQFHANHGRWMQLATFFLCHVLFCGLIVIASNRMGADWGVWWHRVQLRCRHLLRNRGWIHDEDCELAFSSSQIYTTQRSRSNAWLVNSELLMTIDFASSMTQVIDAWGTLDVLVNNAGSLNFWTFTSILYRCRIWPSGWHNATGMVP